MLSFAKNLGNFNMPAIFPFADGDISKTDLTAWLAFFDIRVKINSNMTDPKGDDLFSNAIFHFLGESRFLRELADE